ncbi:amidohydrolase family protein [Caenimonas soli]|uniref:amidohydrolase family protein n=1 Tax=Caenimonas soli TaxID=2735555 RepID=UPI0015580D6F|nr:amidohydrolase family protein [Caenimonas soli]NPC58245.1 amidohydrolase family protein [Caenimonas soli]
MTRVLIEGGYVIPVDTNRVIEKGVVAFDGSTITYVGDGSDFDRAQFRAERTVDASGKAVIPGMVNTHTHLVGAYIKGLTEDVPGKANSAGLYKRALPVASRAEGEDLYWAALTHGMEMVMTGTTTISNTWNDEKHTAPALVDLGARGILSEMIWGTDTSKLGATVMDRPWDTGMVARGLDNARELFENWHGKADGRITTRISPAGPGYCSADAIEQCRDLAASQGVGLNIHIAEVPGETEFVLKQYGMRPIELGQKLGIMGPNTIGFHCVFLSDSDIEIFASSQAHLSHTSFHVPKRGYFPPMEKVYEAGVNVSFGSDWCSNDLWKFMRFGILIPRVKTGDVGMLNGYDALRMATMGGARAVGMADKIGSLEAGKKADIVLVDLETPWCNPIYTPNLITNLVYNANGSDVTDVFVDGVQVVKNGEMTTIDRKATLKETQRRAERLWAIASKTWG